MDLVERARGSLSRSTLLLRESILEADEEGAGEGRRGAARGGGYRERRTRDGRGWRVGESQQEGRAEVAVICKERRRTLVRSMSLFHIY